MNIFLIILLIIAAIIVLVLVIALFSKKEYYLEREVTVNRPNGVVFDYVKFLKNQDHYSKWVMMDPNKKKEFRGNDGTVGFVYGWNGNKQAGAGEQEIVKIVEGRRIDTEVRFERPFKGVSQTSMVTENGAGNETKLRWSFGSKMNYPMNIFLLFMNMDKMLGKDLEVSLANLKGILEKK